MDVNREQEGTVAFPQILKNAEDLGTFIAAIQRLSSARTTEEVAAVAASAARGLIGADGVTFVLRDGDLCYYAEEDSVSPLWKGRRFPLDACISGWCMRRGQAVAIPDVYVDDRIPDDLYRPTFVRSLAMVPVRREDPLGAMGAYWADKHQIHKDDLDLLQTMADAAALAIANAELREKEKHAENLQREVSHRIKNIFAVTRSLLRQTKAASAADYRNTLEGRLRALEQSSTAVFESGQDGLNVRDMLEKLLSAYSRRFDLKGKAGIVTIPGSEGTDLALTINELCSNATKHGAWSTEEGLVTLCCDKRESVLVLDWKESGGPTIHRPFGSGFGTRFIRAIASKHGGDVELGYRPDGFHCKLTLPVSERSN